MLKPNVMVLGDGICGKELGLICQEGRMLLNGIRVIVKNPEGACFLTVLFSHLRTQQEDSLPNTGKGLIRTQPGRWSLIWDFMPSGTLRYKLLLVKPHILWHSATAAMTQTVVLLKLPWKPWQFLKIWKFFLTKLIVEMDAITTFKTETSFLISLAHSHGIGL